LVVVNGHINQVIETTREDVKYKEPALLLRNDGYGNFQNMRELAGPAFSREYVARGLAVGDIDNDGDPDIVITTLNGPPVLLKNNVGQDSNWIGFSLLGTRSNRDAIGAKMTVSSANRKLVRWISGGGSYLASHDRRILVGLGGNARAVNVEVRWPSGILQHLSNLKPNQYHRIVEPSGRGAVGGSK